MNIGSVALFFSTTIMFILCVLLIFRKGAKTQDWFSPTKVFSYFTLVSLPSYWFTSFDKTYLHPLVFRSPLLTDFEATLACTSVLILVAFVSTVLGLLVKSETVLMKFFSVQARFYSNRELSKAKPFWIFALGVAIWFLYMQHLGGVAYVLQNLLRRTLITRGTGYFLNLWQNLILISVVLLIFVTSQSKYTKFLSFRNVSCLLLGFVLLVSLGGRNPVIRLFWFVVLMINYYKVKIRPFSLKTIMIIVVPILLFGIFYGQVRSLENPLDFRNYDKDFLTETFGSAGKTLVLYTGGLERKLLATAYAGKHDKWFGATYRDILTAPIPRTMFPEKPPVDDGMYIYSIALGRNVSPPMPVKDLSTSSWPVGNWMGLLNWGFPGLVILSFLSGLIMKASYKAFIATNKNLFLFFVYSYISFRGPLALSNLSIVAFLTFLVFLHMSLFLIKISARVTVFPKKSTLMRQIFID